MLMTVVSPLNWNFGLSPFCFSLLRTPPAELLQKLYGCKHTEILCCEQLMCLGINRAIWFKKKKKKSV